MVRHLVGSIPAHLKLFSGSPQAEHKPLHKSLSIGCLTGPRVHDWILHRVAPEGDSSEARVQQHGVNIVGFATPESFERQS